MKYVALLRGINVGGNNKVSMQELRQVFEQAGMSNVSTYINSGNVLFESSTSPKAALAQTLEIAIKAKFGFVVKVLVYSGAELLAIAKQLPDIWTNDDSMKCDVMFLWEEVDNPEVLEQLAIKPDIDTVKYVPGALLWSADRKQLTRSGMMKLAGTDLYKQMTIRNCNTLRKLAHLIGQP